MTAAKADTNPLREALETMVATFGVVIDGCDCVTCRIVQSARAALASEPVAGTVEREAIARIIDPGAYADRDNRVSDRHLTIALALKKADAILALGATVSPQGRGAEQPWRTPATWKCPTNTVADLVSNLQTIDQSMEVHGVHFVDGVADRARARGLSLSRERVANGRIRAGDESVPYSLVIWTAQDEATTPAPGAADSLRLGDAVYVNERSPYFHDWRNSDWLKVVSLRLDPDGKKWASVTEGNQQHRGYGIYDGETDGFDADHLSTLPRADRAGQA